MTENTPVGYTLDVRPCRGLIWRWVAQLWDERGRCVKITVHRSTDAAVRWGRRMAIRDSHRQTYRGPRNQFWRYPL